MELQPSVQKREWAAASLAFLCVLIASLLVLRADKAYNQTYDETAHIACGMEWLSQGTYTLETLHPPLARVATAVIPYVFGARSPQHVRMAEDGTAILNLHGRYAHNLLQSRLGILPFFWLASFLVYRFMRIHFSAWHGALAVLLLSFCPVVLAHSAIASTDMPLVATFLLAVLSFSLFLRKGTFAYGLLATSCFGLAVLTKFSAIPFFLVSGGILTVARAIAGKCWIRPAVQLGLVLVCCAPIIWAGYRFSYQPLFTPQTTYPLAQVKLDRMSPSRRALLTKTRVPAPEFFRGLYLTKQNGDGTLPRQGYLLGKLYSGGRWDFFPVGILTKTPLAMLLLCLAGAIVSLRLRRQYGPEIVAVPWAGVAGPLLVGVVGNINIGLRHVLPIYPFLAMFAATGAMWLWHLPARQRAAWPVCTALLLTWSVASCLVAAPEFLPYFNELAGKDPGHVLVDSDLDWGQDFYKLESKLRDVPPDQVWYDYFGDATIVKHQSQQWHELKDGQRPSGVLAVSETRYQEHPELYGWLSGLPYTRVGRSIRVYRVPNP